MRQIIMFICGCLLSLLTANVYAQNISVRGVVLDDMNEPLPGANVYIKGTSKGTMTDIDGKFTLQVPNSKSILVISYIGYKDKEITVGKQQDLKVVLESNSELIDEVVIVGFGTQKKINATGSVKTIDNKVFESRPLTDAVQGLQGTIAGLNITNDQGGALGQKMEINIRGIGSIDEGSSSAPLVLIDGMEGDLSTINPNDIENVSVLKDAAAASIYGSRAPFGVILIKTKSGSSRITQVNYTGNVRISNPIKVPQMVDSYTYALMINDAFINAGGGAQFGQGQLDKILQYQRGELPYGIEKVADQNDWTWGQRSFGNTDWYDTYLKKATVSQEHNVSVSGGTDKVNFYFSGNYLDQTGLFNYADEQFQRLSINGKVGVNFNKYVQLVWNSRLVNTENDKPTAMNDLFFHNLGRRSPLMPLYMPNGEYNRESMIPAMKDGGRVNNKNQQLYNQATLTITPIEKWNIHVELNSRLESPRDTRQFKKIQSSLPDGTLQYISVLEGVADKTEVKDNGSFNRQPAAGVSYFEKGNGRVNYFNTNIYTNYDWNIDKHAFGVLLGGQSEYYYTETTRVASDDILLDDKPFLPSGAGTNTMMSDKKGEWSSLGFFGRINYNYDERYMAEVNLRYDGASRFPSNQRWAFFPSFSVGWNIASEPFWESLNKAGFEYLKLRGSYGKLGSQNTTSFYPYYQKMEAKNASLVLGGQQAVSLPMYNPYSVSLTWEKIENMGAALEWGFFKNRFTGTLEWFQRSTKDMVGPSKSLPSIYGASAPKTNNAELRNRGWEFEIGWRDQVNKNFGYGISATFSDYQTEITRYDSPDGKLDGWYSGKKYGDIWGYETIGIAKSDKEMTDYLALHDQSSIGSKWGGGDIMYKDLNNDGRVDKGSETVNDYGDLKVIGNGTPRFAYSFTLDARYKFIDFRAFFQGIGKRDVFFKDSATFFGMVGAWQRSLYTNHLDYFRYAGETLGANMDDPYYGRIRTDRNNSQVCDRFMQNAAYLRLKNLQIGFNLPEYTKLSKYVKRARLYVSGENLFTITKLKIYDPEAVGKTDSAYGPGKTYPMYRVWSIGLDVTF